MDFDIKHYNSLENFVDKNLLSSDYEIGRLFGTEKTWFDFYVINPDSAFTNMDIVIMHTHPQNGNIFMVNKKSFLAIPSPQYPDTNADGFILSGRKIFFANNLKPYDLYEFQCKVPNRKEFVNNKEINSFNFT